MKVVVLSDNRKGVDDCGTEHGLSLYLEAETTKWLLDAGASSLFMENAVKLGVDIEDVDFVFLSHGHSDHTGGLLPFLNANHKAAVVCSEKVFSKEYFSVRGKEIKRLTNSDDFICFEHRFEWSKERLSMYGFYILNVDNLKYPAPKANGHLYVKEIEGEWINDDFSHEMVFAWELDDGWFVYSGCSHKGLLNMMEKMNAFSAKPVKFLFGGFHLPDGKYESVSEISKIARTIKSKYPSVQLFTSHCTGDRAYVVMKDILGHQLHRFYAGYSFDF